MPDEGDLHRKLGEIGAYPGTLCELMRKLGREDESPRDDGSRSGRLA